MSNWKINVNEHSYEYLECGKLQIEVSSNGGSKSPAKWYLTTQSPKKPFGGAPNTKKTNLVHIGGTGTKNLNATLLIEPSEVQPGKSYYVVARTYGNANKWHWSSERIHYYPEINPVLHWGLDGTGEYDLGKIPCDSPLRLEPLEQSCLAKYKIRVKRVHDGKETGPEIWLTGGWWSGPIGAMDLRELAARVGHDFVPGQCYKVDVFADRAINGGQWPSAGKIFCIDCCCD